MDNEPDYQTYDCPDQANKDRALDGVPPQRRQAT
jgi:hypothetical protein